MSDTPYKPVGLPFLAEKLNKKQPARKSVGLSDLLACPFCGNDVDVEADEENEFPYFIECKRCYIRTDNYVIKNHLIERWNRRAS